MRQAAQRFLALAVALVLSGCGTGTVYQPAARMDVGTGAVQTVQIFANGDWRDTGVQLQRGQSYLIQAEGAWSNGAFCGTTDASGAGVSPLCGGDPWGIGAVGSSMIGRIGLAGRPFPVGKSKVLVAPEDGTLFLRDYDLIEFDNVGSVTATIARAAAPASPRVDTPPPPAPAAVPSRFAEQPVPVRFAKRPERPDDVAVIIGNADYSRQGHDIPDVRTAYADAESMRRYVVDGLGMREGNVIFLKDATGIQLAEVFGNERDYRGRLFNWVKPGKSRVFVYYIGHGAPGNAEGRAMLVPVDASAGQIALSGYPLDLLYANLGKVPAESITVVLDACFSGTSPAGSVMGNALPVAIAVKPAPIPATVTVISAAAVDQIANWEPDNSHAMFTEFFLKGMSGEADKPPYGNGDGTVTLDELGRYLKETLSYWVRRDYGRDQTAQIVKGREVP